mmetsp:Transcript_1746/g.3628  ORF Transcript_1746/g.3628 Transcript_1746/m.3628 type:complete len:328 (+) Transcript_1746:239-1222(+)
MQKNAPGEPQDYFLLFFFLPPFFSSFSPSPSPSSFSPSPSSPPSLPSTQSVRVACHSFLPSPSSFVSSAFVSSFLSSFFSSFFSSFLSSSFLGGSTTLSAPPPKAAKKSSASASSTMTSASSSSASAAASLPLPLPSLASLASLGLLSLASFALPSPLLPSSLVPSSFLSAAAFSLSSLALCLPSHSFCCLLFSANLQFMRPCGGQRVLFSTPLFSLMAVSACERSASVTKPKPLESLVSLSLTTTQSSTSPYFEKHASTSSSVDLILRPPTYIWWPLYTAAKRCSCLALWSLRSSSRTFCSAFHSSCFWACSARLLLHSRRSTLRS